MVQYAAGLVIAAEYGDTGRFGFQTGGSITIMKAPISCAALTLLVSLTAGQALSAAQNCSNADLKGVYGMLATGSIVVAPPPVPTGPFARVGRVVADGNGNIAITNTASYNGAIIAESYNATYSVNSDCAVDVKPLVPLPIGPGGSFVPVPFEFIGAVADNGNSVAVVLCGVGAPCFTQPPGSVIRVLLSRKDVNQAPCTTGNLSGAFQVDMAGAVVSGPVPGPFARDGRLVFDGRGGFSGHATAVYSGFVVQAEDISGQYSVDSLCNVSIGFTSGTAHSWTGTLTDRGNGADLIVAENGVVIAGTLKKQKPGDDQE